MTAAAMSVIGLGCLLVAATSQQIGRLQTGTRASLAGVVRSSVTTQPVPNIEVRIRLSGDADWKTSTTDESGRYGFTNLVPGRYLIRLSGPDYYAEFEDVILPGGRETKLSLFKRAILEGRVIDDLGQPVPGIEVCALRYAAMRQDRPIMPAEYAITDSNGVFRMSRTPARPSLTLGPGQFLLAVVPTGCLLAETGRPHKALPLEGIVPTFFPNVTSFKDATVITVSGDEHQKGFEIRLRRGPSTRLEGRVAPLPQTLLPPVARVILEPPADALPITRVLNLGPDGRFVFDGVLPGEYRLIVPPTWRLNARSVWAEQRLPVTGAPNQTVFVPTKPTMEVTGRILFDGQPTLLPGVRVFLTVNLVGDRPHSRVDPLFLPEAFGHVDGAGRFAITGVMPGRYTFTISGADARGWILEGATIPAAPSSTVTERDVFNLPFDVTDGLDITDATISMTRAASMLRVLVEDLADQPVSSATIVLFSADPKHWFPGSRRVLSQRVETKGVVTFEDLPKGDYVVATIPGTRPYSAAQPPNWYIARGLEPLVSGGTKVRLEASETRTITVRIVPKTVQ
jgi:carboxypeptidase family protein